MYGGDDDHTSSEAAGVARMHVRGNEGPRAGTTVTGYTSGGDVEGHVNQWSETSFR